LAHTGDTLGTHQICARMSLLQLTNKCVSRSLSRMRLCVPRVSLSHDVPCAPSVTLGTHQTCARMSFLQLTNKCVSLSVCIASLCAECVLHGAGCDRHDVSGAPSVTLGTHETCASHEEWRESLI